MTPEGRVKAIVKKRFAAAFPKAWRFMPVQSGYGSPALDFIYCIDGVFVTVETKKDEKSKLTPTQETTATAINTAGGIVCLIYDEASCDRAIAAVFIALKFGRKLHDL